MLIGFFIIFFAVKDVAAHCEIPCGIYDDEMRINMIAEHITTIEKTMKQIGKLADSKPIDYNQLTRWITNKEHHADALQKIVTQYFMTQRIKPDTKNYSQKLTVLHKMLLAGLQEIDAPVYDNPFQPGTEGDIAPVLIHFGKGADKGLLGDILGIRRLVDKPHRHTKHAPCVLLIQCQLGLPVVVPALRDQVRGYQFPGFQSPCL